MGSYKETSNTNFHEQITGFLERRPVIYQFLRFACIGMMNTGLNFLILNAISKALGISHGPPLGMIGGIAFCAAVVQSYLWNRTWTFGSELGVSLWKNFVRLVLVGLLGGLAVVFVLIGSQYFAPWYYFFGVLTVFLIFETVLWKHFGFHLSDWNHQGHSFVIFFVVTLIGLGIYVSLLSIISTHLHLFGTDLDKNVAAIAATGVSLFWNFTGYKIIVFKK